MTASSCEAPGQASTERSERMLRWKSRDSSSETQLDVGRDADQTKTPQQEQAGPTVSTTTSANSKPGAARIRPESPSRKGESVRQRKPSMDIDPLDSSTETYACRFEPGSGIPSYTGLLNPPLKSVRKEQTPRRSETVLGSESGRRSTTGAAEEWKSKKVLKNVIKDEEKAQILKARKLLECRSNSSPKSSSRDEERMHRPVVLNESQEKTSGHRSSHLTQNSDTSTEHSKSHELLDLKEMAKELAIGGRNNAAFRRNNAGPLGNSTTGYENVYYSPKSESLRNQILQGKTTTGRDLHLWRSSPTITEIPGMLPNSANDRSQGDNSPQVRARNAFLERLHIERGHGRSESVILQSRSRQPGINQSVQRGEPLSQSARFGQPGPTNGFPRSQKLLSLKTMTSGSPSHHQGLRKVVDSHLRTSGLSMSCRRASITDEVFDISGENQNSAHHSHVTSPRIGCRPSPLRQSMMNSEVNSRNDVDKVDGHTDLRPGNGVTSSLVASKSKPSPRPASPGRSFKKWVASQFQFGTNGSFLTSKKNKDVSPPPTPEQKPRPQPQAASQGKMTPWSVKLPTELLGSMAKSLSASRAPGHRRTQSTAGAVVLVGSRFHDREDAKETNTKVGSRRFERRGSLRRQKENQETTQDPAGPRRSRGLQNLFNPEGQSPAAIDVDQGFQTDCKPKRTMKFLECEEIADLNDFLRAKRDSFTSCQNDRRGYLKFISTKEPTDVGSMVSAICYSYFMEKRGYGSGRWNVVPLINFPRWRMKDHLDAAWLFNVCGLDVKGLLFTDEVDVDCLSRVGVTVKTMTIGEDILNGADEVGSCCTLLGEMFLKDAEHLWSRSSPFLKTLLLAGLLMDTDNLSKLSTSTSRDHQMLLNLSTGAGPLGRFGLYDRMKAVHTDPEVLKMAKKYYGITEERCIDAPAPPPPPALKVKNFNKTILTSSKGSPLFSSSTDDDSGSSTSRSSSSTRSRSNSPAVNTADNPQGLSVLGRLPTDTQNLLGMG